MSQLKEIVEKNLLPGLILLDMKEDMRGSFIRIVVDGEHQVTLDETTKLSKKLRDHDEFESKFPNGFRLEITTPGLDRPLEHVFQYKRNINRMIKVSYKSGDITETTTGKLIEVTDLTILLDVQGEKLKIPMSDILKAIVKISFK